MIFLCFKISYYAHGFPFLELGLREEGFLLNPEDS